MIRKAILIVVAIVVLWVGIHDGRLYVNERRRLQATTYELTKWASANAGRMSRDRVANRIFQMGADQGVRVYQYGQDGLAVEVWTDSQVEGTWVLATLVDLFRSGSWKHARSATLTVQDHREAPLQ